MKKTKLKSDVLFDFELYGLICTEKEYKLAWLINQVIKIRLIKQKDIEIDFVGDKKLEIANFLSKTEHSSIRLLKNKTIQGGEKSMIYLLPELANFDYFLLIQGFDDQYKGDYFRKSLQRIKQISFVQSLDMDKIKSRHNLLF